MFHELLERERQGSRGRTKATVGSSGHSLVRRLNHTSDLVDQGSASHGPAPQSAVAWSADGSLMLGGGEDAVLKIWDLSRSRTRPVHSFDTGHTSCIFGASFMPDTCNTQIATCSADRQVRVIDLGRSAVRPYVSHRSRVKTLATVSNVCIISGGEDGTVRRWDTREPGPDPSQEQQNRSLLVEQRSERVGRAGVRVGVNSLAVDPTQPHIFATGGSDPLVRVFDMRMLHRPSSAAALGAGGSGGGDRVPWLYCLIPEHMKDSLTVPPVWHTPMQRLRHITGLCFTDSGHDIVASYSGERIYSFATRKNARSYDSIFSSASASRQLPIPTLGLSPTLAAPQGRVLHPRGPGLMPPRPAATRQPAAAASAPMPPPPARPPTAPTVQAFMLFADRLTQHMQAAATAAAAAATAAAAAATAAAAAVGPEGHVGRDAAAPTGARAARAGAQTGAAAAAGPRSTAQGRSRPRRARAAPGGSEQRPPGFGLATEAGMGPGAAAAGQPETALSALLYGQGAAANYVQQQEQQQQQQEARARPRTRRHGPAPSGPGLLGQQPSGMGGAPLLPLTLQSAPSAGALVAGAAGGGGGGGAPAFAFGVPAQAGPSLVASQQQPAERRRTRQQRRQELQQHQQGSEPGPASASMQPAALLSLEGERTSAPRRRRARSPAAAAAAAPASALDMLGPSEAGPSTGIASGSASGAEAWVPGAGGRGRRARASSWALPLGTSNALSGGLDTAMGGADRGGAEGGAAGPVAGNAAGRRRRAGSHEAQARDRASEEEDEGRGQDAPNKRFRNEGARDVAQDTRRRPGAGDAEAGPGPGQRPSGSGAAGGSGGSVGPGAQGMRSPFGWASRLFQWGWGSQQQQPQQQQQQQQQREGGNAAGAAAAGVPSAAALESGGAAGAGPGPGSLAGAPVGGAGPLGRPAPSSNPGGPQRSLSMPVDPPGSSMPPDLPDLMSNSVNASDGMPPPIGAVAGGSGMPPGLASHAELQQQQTQQQAASRELRQPPRATRPQAGPAGQEPRRVGGAAPGRGAVPRVGRDVRMPGSLAPISSSSDDDDEGGEPQRAAAARRRSRFGSGGGHLSGLGGYAAEPAAAAAGAAPAAGGPGLASRVPQTRAASARGRAAATQQQAHSPAAGTSAAALPRRGSHELSPGTFDAGAGASPRGWPSGPPPRPPPASQPPRTRARAGVPGLHPPQLSPHAGSDLSGGGASPQDNSPSALLGSLLHALMHMVHNRLLTGPGGGQEERQPGQHGGHHLPPAAGGIGAGVPGLQGQLGEGLGGAGGLLPHPGEGAAEGDASGGGGASGEGGTQPTFLDMQRRARSASAAAQAQAEADVAAGLAADPGRRQGLELTRRQARGAAARAARHGAGGSSGQARRGRARCGGGGGAAAGAGGGAGGGGPGGSSSSSSEGEEDQGVRDAGPGDDRRERGAGDGRQGHGDGWWGEEAEGGGGQEEEEQARRLGYLKCFEGHRNASGSKNVCLMGRRSRYVVSASDDGHIFVWDLQSAELLNMLPGADGDNCVQAHPFDPVLASCGSEPVVRLWSPEAESAALPNAAQRAILRSNILEIGRAQRQNRTAVELQAAEGTGEAVGRGARRRGTGAQAAAAGAGGGDGAQGAQPDGAAGVQGQAPDDADEEESAQPCQMM